MGKNKNAYRIEIFGKNCKFRKCKSRSIKNGIPVTASK